MQPLTNYQVPVHKNIKKPRSACMLSEVSQNFIWRYIRAPPEAPDTRRPMFLPRAASERLESW